MHARPTRLIASLAIAQFMLAVAAPSFAQTGVLAGGMDELVRLYESGNPKLLEALKHHLSAGPDTVLVKIHLKAGGTAAQALPLLEAEGFQLQAISNLDPRLIEGYLPLWAARSTSWEFGVESVLAVQRPFRFAGAVQSQAVAVQKADLAQSRGIDGAGIRLGALSDSYDACRRTVRSTPLTMWRPATCRLASSSLRRSRCDRPGTMKGARCCSWFTMSRRARRSDSPARSTER